jgi:hypothetical protein
MFYALCTAVCLAVLFIVIAGTLLLSSGGGWLLRRFAPSLAPALLSNILFGLRLLPFIAGLVFILGFALPSFLRFEPHSTNEGVGLKLVLLSMLGAAVIGRIGYQWIRMRRTTTRVLRQWLQKAEPLHAAGSAPVYVMDGNQGLVAVLGTRKPKIFVARGVLSALSSEEFAAVLAHELGHVKALDNLKQILLKITQPPAWFRSLKSLDTVWGHASEMAADEAALAEGVAVEDLASALVKVSKLGCGVPSVHMAACHLVPDANHSVIGDRVLHLQALLNGEARPASRSGIKHWKRLTVLAATACALIYVAGVNLALPVVHEAIEWLVR